MKILMTVSRIHVIMGPVLMELILTHATVNQNIQDSLVMNNTAIQTGQRSDGQMAAMAVDGSRRQPAKYSLRENIALVGLTDLAGRTYLGHLKILLTVKEEQHLSALNVVVKKRVLGKNVLVIEGQKIKPKMGILVFRGRSFTATGQYGRRVMAWMKITVETPMEKKTTSGATIPLIRIGKKDWENGHTVS